MASEDVKEPLIVDDDRYFDESGRRSPTAVPQRRRKTSTIRTNLFYGFVLCPWILLVLLGGWSRHALQQCKSRYYIRPDLTYSPVQDLVEYETKIFTTGHAEDPDYSPFAAEPSDEVDAVWKTLYPSMDSPDQVKVKTKLTPEGVYQLIPRDQAARLTNKTVIFPHDEQRRYIIELDVFHQLHCLNMVRKATRPDYYRQQPREDGSEDPLLGPRHIAHCIDAIRQSLMCASDITVYTWQWDEEHQVLANQVKNPHTCRNFDALREWSRIHTEQIYPDFDFHEPNDPLDPSTWIDGYKGD